MEIIISSNTSKPIYEQITSQMKAMIMSGELQTGDPIPSMRALAKSLHISVITVSCRHKIKISFKRSNSAGRKNISKRLPILHAPAVSL